MVSLPSVSNFGLLRVFDVINRWVLAGEEGDKLLTLSLNSRLLYLGTQSLATAKSFNSCTHIVFVLNGKS